MCVVAVSTLEHHTLAVDEDLAVAVLYLAESVFLCADIAVHVDVYGIEVGRLSCPELRLLYLEEGADHPLLALCELLGRHLADLHQFALWVIQFALHQRILSLLAQVLQRQVYVQLGKSQSSASEVRCQVGIQIGRAHV